ncbi:MAG TPA: hypothetical protein VF514_09105 [Bacteroidota bacterium]
MIGAQKQSPGTREIIRVAEKHIEAREFDLAMEKLSTAQRMEPDNIYITAIVERIHRIASESSNGGRFLGLTVGNEFEEGIKSVNEAARPPEGVDMLIRRLTAKATELIRQGAYETAFDSLMNAYLLDPVNLTLMESEKTLLPAIEMMRRQKSGKMGSQRMSGLSFFPPSERRTDSSTLSAEDSQRLEELKRQKEAERTESERAMWREASRLPRILGEMLEPVPPKEPENSPPAPPEQGEQKEPGGFFSKLRHGKFLI